MNKLNYIIVILLIALVACEKESNDSSVAVQPPRVTVEVNEDADPQTEIMANEATSIFVRGYIDVPPANKAAISPYFGGFVKKINVLPGQAVNKGEVLFVLENPEYLKTQQEYIAAKEQLAYLKTDFERQNQLASENIASTKNAMKAESDYKVMRARYTSLKKQIELMGLSVSQLEKGFFSSSITIKAPISGSVTKLLITNSEYADAKKVALEIINPDHIHLELEVFEHDALQVKIGQAIEFTIPEIDSEKYTGEVYLVANFIEPDKRTVKVHGHLDDETEVKLFPGMFINARIDLEE